MTREIAINRIREIERCTPIHTEDDVKDCKALEMAIQALSQESEIEENIIKYMKKYPNHVGNTDFWEGFYACRNVVLQLDDEEYAPKEQEPCDAISREAAITIAGTHTLTVDETVKALERLPSVTHKSGVEPQESETWNGIHGQITAPKGTFKKIFEDESGDRE